MKEDITLKIHFINLYEITRKILKDQNFNFPSQSIHFNKIMFHYRDILHFEKTH